MILLKQKKYIVVALLCSSQQSMAVSDMAENSKQIPERILGLYSQKTRSCTGGYGGYKPECIVKPDWLLITPLNQHQVGIKFELNFDNGHICAAGFSDEVLATGQWDKQQLQVTVRTVSNRKLYQQCQMSIRFNRRGLKISDPNGDCTRQLCGARGGLNDFNLPRRSVFQ